MAQDLKIGNQTFENVSKVSAINTDGSVVYFTLPSESDAVAGTILNASQYKTGTYPCTSGNDVLSGITIDIGFKPKVFFIIGVGSIYNGSDATPYKLGSSIAVYDNDGNALLHYSTFIMKGDSTNGYGRGGASGGNGFAATSTGVQGFGENIKAASGITYNWYAWA